MVSIEAGFVIMTIASFVLATILAAVIATNVIKK